MEPFQVHMTDEFVTGDVRLHIFQRGRELTTYLASFDHEGRPTFRTSEPGIVMTHPGFLIPRAALLDIAEKLKPGPSQGETKRLEEALGIERARVDKILEGLL